jgi:hypothetical protein
MEPHYRIGLGMVGFFATITSSGVTSSGLEHLAERPRTLYISNHADIVREPTLINRELHRKGLPLAHIAAGENLFAMASMQLLLSLQPIFPVPREPGQGARVAQRVEEELEEHPVWVAQGSGRSKTGNYHTHPHLLVNLAAARGVSVDEYVRQTNIIPVAISTEYEPTAAVVARILKSGKKSRADDLLAVTLGIWGWKGAAHVAFSPPLAGEFPKAYVAASAIDDAILLSYRCFATNREAHEERSRYPPREWTARPVDMRRIHNPLLCHQLYKVDPALRPYILARYAMPEHNRLLIAGKH